jgi:hypothetical protein
MFYPCEKSNVHYVLPRCDAYSIRDSPNIFDEKAWRKGEPSSWGIKTLARKSVEQIRTFKYLGHIEKYVNGLNVKLSNLQFSVQLNAGCLEIWE